MKLMIVEDNPQIRRMLRSFLEDLVDEFVECSDGSEALIAYSEHHPDLVLMDVQMKHLDGLDTTREIKSAFPGARVVMVSHWDSPALREAATKAGAEGYVRKVSLLPLREIISKSVG
jgi:CheY-like chemotaxis protein